LDTLPAFLGRFHPLWVHLPIGILALLGILEASSLASRLPRLGWLPRLPPGLRTLVLAIGAAAAVVAALLGRMLAGTGGYDPAAVSGHQALGYAAAGAAVAALAVHRVRLLYGPVLLVSLGLLAAAGHAGGRITHGSGYLTARMPAGLAQLLGVAPPAAAVPVDFAHARLFADAVAPVLRGRCVSCHGAEKQNGGLRLDSWEALQKGGKHGPVLNGSDPAKGSLLERIDLPLEEKGHMPPRGRPPLSDDDLAVLEWWAGSGYPPDSRLTALDPPAAVASALAARLGGPAEMPPPDRAATLAQAGRLEARLGIRVRPMSPDAPWIDVSAKATGQPFGDAELAQLAPLAPAVQWLDLGGTSVSDAGMGTVSRMTNLVRLHLDLTRVTDEGLRRLGALRHLEYLNLRGTAVTDQGLQALRSLPRLRSLYVWQTAVSEPAVRALGQALVDRRKIDRWRAERDELGRLIDAERFDGNTGESLLPAPESPPVPDPKK
jgi:hypothetical protein